MSSKRMTANPIKPARYRAGKPVGTSSSESDSDGSENEAPQSKPASKPQRAIAPPPKVRSAGTVISGGSGIAKREEEERRAAAARARTEAERLAKEEGFVTDEEDDDEEGDGEEGESGSQEEDESSEEESSEEEAPRRLMMRPKFVLKKGGSNGASGVEKDAVSDDDEAKAAAREAAANELVEEQIRKNIAARKAGKKHWDDPEDEAGSGSEAVDDTDGLDPEAEHAAWRLRELRRVRRDREAIEEREREIAELERRRNLTVEERAAEDEAHIAHQREEKEGRGKMAYLQKYYHKGAFYQDESRAEGLAGRDVMGAGFADDVKNRELLPKALQMRDMTKLGRKGATKYKDLKSEDTGQWGRWDDRPRRDYDRFGDERFRRDDDQRDWDRERGGDGGKGANAVPLGDRRPVSVPGAPDGPRNDRARVENRLHERENDGDADRYRSRDDGRERRRSRSKSPRRDSRDRDDYRDRRKRESSRDRDRYEGDKRRRVDTR